MWAMSCESNKTTVKPNCDNVNGNGETCSLLISFCKFSNHTLWLTPPFHLHAKCVYTRSLRTRVPPYLTYGCDSRMYARKQGSLTRWCAPPPCPACALAGRTAASTLRNRSSSYQAIRCPNGKRGGQGLLKGGCRHFQRHRPSASNSQRLLMTSSIRCTQSRVV